jgi:hypothetical protein
MLCPGPNRVIAGWFRHRQEGVERAQKRCLVSARISGCEEDRLGEQISRANFPHDEKVPSAWRRTRIQSLRVPALHTIERGGTPIRSALSTPETRIAATKRSDKTPMF